MMTDRLFGSVEQREGAISEGETTFEFLRRGGRPEAVEVRDHIESWFHPIPRKNRIGLKKRLQDKNFHTFMSACFELQLHHILLQLGCKVAIERTFNGSDKTVDFHVVRDRQEFYLEATVCGLTKDFLNCSNNEYLAVARLREALTDDLLLHSDLHLQAEGELKATLGKELVAPFRQLLRDHSAETVSRLIGQYGHGYWTFHWRIPNPPIVKFECGGWVLTGWLATPVASNGLGSSCGTGEKRCLRLGGNNKKFSALQGEALEGDQASPRLAGGHTDIHNCNKCLCA